MAQAFPSPYRNDKLGSSLPAQGPQGKLFLHCSVHSFIKKKKKKSSTQQMTDPVLITCASQTATSVVSARMGMHGNQTGGGGPRRLQGAGCRE